MTDLGDWIEGLKGRSELMGGRPCNRCHKTKRPVSLWRLKPPEASRSAAVWLCDKCAAPFRACLTGDKPPLRGHRAINPE